MAIGGTTGSEEIRINVGPSRGAGALLDVTAAPFPTKGVLVSRGQTTPSVLPLTYETSGTVTPPGQCKQLSRRAQDAVRPQSVVVVRQTWLALHTVETPARGTGGGPGEEGSRPAMVRAPDARMALITRGPSFMRRRVVLAVATRRLTVPIPGLTTAAASRPFPGKAKGPNGVTGTCLVPTKVAPADEGVAARTKEPVPANGQVMPCAFSLVAMTTAVLATGSLRASKGSASGRLVGLIPPSASLWQVESRPL